MVSSKDKHDVVIIGDALPSVLLAMDYVKKNRAVLFLNNLEQKKIEHKGINLYPYEFPISSLSDYDYDHDHDELFIAGKGALGIIFNDKRFDFFEQSITEEIKSFFPEYEEPFNCFIAEILKKSACIKNKKKFFSSMSYIDQLYDRYDLPVCIKSVLDAVLFVFSGIRAERFPAMLGIKILGSVLRGLSIPKDGEISLREGVLKILSQKIKVENHSKDLTVKGLGKLIISDHDHMKTAFLDNMSRLKNEYSDNVIYPYSIYVKIPKELVPNQMNRWSLYIETDKSMILNKDDVYTIRLFIDNEFAVIRISSFLGYGSFDVNHSIHRNKNLKMYEILKNIIPVIEVFDSKVFPDAKSESFDSELELLFDSLKYGDVVYKEIPDRIRRTTKVIRG